MTRASLSPDTIGGSIDDRMIAAMRLVLALSALLIIYIDPSEPDRFVPITYTALVLYTSYSVFLYLLAVRRFSLFEAVHAWSHWADVGWYLLLIALSSGTNSIFFFFFFFAILATSFRQGFPSGLRVSVVSSFLFTVIGYATTPAGQLFELNRFLLRPIYLLVLGYMMAYWGGYEINLRRRLALLREVGILSNPRFGIGRTIGVIMERLRTFYDADICLIVISDPDTEAFRLRRTDRDNPEGGMHADAIGSELAGQLLGLPPECGLVYNRLRLGFWRWEKGYYAYDLAKRDHTPDGQRAAKAMANLLDATSFVSVPLRFHNNTTGRVYLVSLRRHAFAHADVDFLIQVFDQTIPVLDNIRLVDKLATEAAEEERQRIARNIHDSVIQPYLGLQIGLTSVRQRLVTIVADTNGELQGLIQSVTGMIGRVDKLIDMTNAGIGDLRRYVSGLKGRGEHEATLLPSARRFAAKFADATGISVEVEADADIHITDRLAAEVFQMIIEGLSNIRRHTQARRARIKLSYRSDHLILRIENDCAELQTPVQFTPRSISGRAESLGGRVRVEPCVEENTVVVVEVPL